jgi:hypothetical protein
MAERCAPSDGKIDPRVGFAFFVAGFVGLGVALSDVVGDLLSAHQRAAGHWGAEYVNAMGLALIAAAPMIALVFGAVAVLRMGLLWAQGHRLSERMASAVKDLGEASMGAAVWAAFLTPNLLRWIPGDGGLTFRFSEFAIATFIVGVGFLAGADVIRDAARKQAESELFV